VVDRPMAGPLLRRGVITLSQFIYFNNFFLSLNG
jgi:hypothetical protein